MDHHPFHCPSKWFLAVLFVWGTLGALDRLGSKDALAAPIPVADVAHAGPVDFEKEILPILTRNCLACHSASKPESELVLENPQTIQKGGSQGPAVLPGKPHESLLLTVAAHKDEPVMPPAGNTVNAKNLTSAELGLLKLWIQQGAQGTVTGPGSGRVWQAPAQDIQPIYAVAISADGRTAATGRAGRIDLYNIPTGMLKTSLVDKTLESRSGSPKLAQAHLDMVESLAFSPNGEWLASGSFREVKFWHRPHHFQQTTLAPAEGNWKQLKLSANRKLAALCNESGQLQVFDLQAGKFSIKLNVQASSPEVAITSFVWLADDQHLLTGGTDRTIRLWDTRTGQQAGGFLAPAAVSALSLVDHSQQLLVGCETGLLQVYPIPQPVTDPAIPLASVNPLRELTGAGRQVTHLVAVNTQGSQFVSATRDGMVRVWDTVSGKPVQSFSHGRELSCLAVNPTARRLATGSEDGTAKLWNLENGQLVADLDRQLSTIDQSEQRQFAIALAERELSSAAADLTRIEKQARDEREGAYLSAVDLTKAEAGLKLKTEALVQPAAEKAKAQEQLVRLQAEFSQAEEKLKMLEAASPAEEDDAARQKHAESLKMAQAEVAKLRGPLDAAATATQKAETAFVKANDEKVIAELAIVAAKRTLEGTQAAADRSQAMVADAATQKLERRRALESARIELDLLQIQDRRLRQDIQELQSEKGNADQAVQQLQTVSQSMPADQVAPADSPEQAAARSALNTAVQNWRDTRQQASEKLSGLQARVESLARAKGTTDDVFADVTNRLKAAVTARDAASKKVTEQQQKLQAAADETGKMVATTEHQNAEDRQHREQADVTQLEAALNSAKATQEEATRQLEEARNQANAQTAAINETVNQARSVLNAARETQRSADMAAGGHQAMLASALEYRQLIGKVLAAKYRPVSGLAFTPDGSTLLLSDSRETSLFSTTDGKCAETRPVESAGWMSGVFLTATQLLGLGADHSFISMDTRREWKLERRIGDVNSSEQLMGLVTSLDFSPDGAWLATGGGEASRMGELKIWDVATGQLVKTMKDAHSDMVLGVKFSPDGTLLASCSADRFMKVFDVSSSQMTKSFEGHTNHVLGVSWRADGRLLATASSDKSCKVWDYLTGETTRALTGYTKDVTALQFLGATDNFITSSGGPQQVLLRNTGGGSGPAFPGTTDFMYCVRASRDGTLVVAGGQDGVLHLWNGQGTAMLSFPPIPANQ